NLPDGSNPNAAALTQTGSFSVDAKDGLATLAIDGKTVIENGQLVLTTVTGQLGNVLTITGYDADTQTLTYSYTLNDREDHGGNADQELSEDFHVVATDSNGDSDDTWLNVRIEDDTPTARDDTNAGVATENAPELDGNVLSNDTLGADYQSEPVTAHTYAGQYGTLVLNADGSYAYTLNENSGLKAGETGVEKFVYTLTDADGDSGTATLTLKVAGTDHPVTLSIECDTLTIQESALDGGSHSNVDGRSVGGTFQVSAPDGLQSLTVGGVDVVKDGQVVEFGTSASSASTPYGTFTVTGFDAASGTVFYTYTLERAADHPSGDGANSVLDNIGIVATDSDGDNTSGQLHIKIVDDTPSANDGGQVLETQAGGTNLMLVIDTSNSMNDSARVGDGSQSRLDFAKDAMDKLLDQYQALGDVRVQIVTFNTEAQQLTSDWVTVSQAKTIIDGLTASGGTNYDYALDQASAAWSADGKLDSAQNVSYFFSDGSPTLSDENPLPSGEQDGRTTQPELGDGISAAEQSAWEGFLSDHDIKSYAIGLGKSAQATYLEPIAYDGTQGKDLPAKVVTDLNDLPATLTGTVTGEPVSGTLVGDNGFGADGGHVKSISLDGMTWNFDAEQGKVTAEGKGDTFSFDASTRILTINTAHGGVLQVDMDSGDYRYAVGTGSDARYQETIGFTLEDGDHDTVSSSITVQVRPAPQAGGDFTATSVQRVVVQGQERVLERSDFHANTTAMVATLLVAGIVGNVEANTRADTLQLSLHKGETVTLSEASSDTEGVRVGVVDAAGHFQAVTGGQFTADSDGTYKLRVEMNNADHSAAHDVKYNIEVNVDYSQVQTSAQPTVQTVPSEHHASIAHALLAQASGAETATATASVADEHTASYQGSAQGVHVDLRDAGFDGLSKLLGSEHDDWLHAGDKGSNLDGGAGNDTLVAGKGSDVLTGGTGGDTFAWEHGASGHDVITDFKVGVDTLDLSQLLGDVAKNASLDDFFKVTVSGAGSDATTHLAVSTSAGGAAAQTIDLQHVNLADQYNAGSMPSSDGLVVNAHDVINGMLGDHSLKVDTV
ncbi:VWA domain-containing protein, partial [Pseudomonas typographi]